MDLLALWLVTVLAMLLPLFVFGYIYMTRHFDYWKKRGVPYLKPIPFFGNFYEMATMKIAAGNGMKKLYDSVDAPYIGIFVFDQPVLLLKSPKLIYDVLIRDVSTFVDRTTANPSHNKINANFMMFQKGLKWKQTRTSITKILSPAKLKRMFGLVEQLTKPLIKDLSKKSTTDLGTAMSGYSAALSARCFFGITTDCIENEDSDFGKHSRSMFEFSWRNVLVQSGYFFEPNLINFLRLDMFKRKITDYFSGIILDVLESRNNPTGKALDLIDIVKEMKDQKRKNGKMTDEEYEELCAIAITFLFAGTETVGSALAFTLYELSLHEEFQERARQEARKVVHEYGGVTYDAALNAKYIDMCIQETLRTYPILPHICREASQSYTFKGTDLTVDKGARIYVPMYGVQMDENNFPNPTEYDPERFLEPQIREGELRFIPFGGGPRGCIGERFGIMVMKTTIIHLLLNFKFEKCPTTPEKVDFEIKSFPLKSHTPLEVKMTPLVEKHQ